LLTSLYSTRLITRTGVAASISLGITTTLCSITQRFPPPFSNPRKPKKADAGRGAFFADCAS
jgi:hypothetical protein